MKSKIITILILICVSLTVTACGKSSQENTQQKMMDGAMRDEAKYKARNNETHPPAKSTEVGATSGAEKLQQKLLEGAQRDEARFKAKRQNQ